MKTVLKYILLFLICFASYLGIKYSTGNEIDFIGALFVALASVVVLYIMNRKKRK